MAQAVIIMSAKGQIRNKWKDPDGTNQIQVEAEEEDYPQQWEGHVVRSLMLIKAEWWGLAFHWKDVKCNNDIWHGGGVR